LFKKRAAESGGKGGSVGAFAWENVTEFAAHERATLRWH
jgi:hypothetical protein